MTSDALSALREAHESDERLRDVGRMLMDEGFTLERIRVFLRELRQQRWRACPADCADDHDHRNERCVEIDESGITVSWEILQCFGDEQQRHLAPGSLCTRQGTPDLRPLPSMERELVEQFIMSVDDIGIAPDGLGLRTDSHDSPCNKMAA